MEPTPEQVIQQVEQLFNEEKYKEIIALLSDELLTHYNNATLYAWRARAHNRLDETELNFTYAQKSIEIDSTLAMPYVTRGNAWSDKREYDKAIIDYSKAIQLDPNDSAAYNNRGNAWAKKQEYDKAIIDLTEAIRLDQNDAYAYNNRGIIWYYTQEYDKAITDFTEAIRLDQNHAYAYYSRGLAWSDKKEYNLSITDYERYIELTTDSNDFLRQVALTEIGDLKKRKANAWYDEIDGIVDKIKHLLLFDNPFLTHYTSMSGARAMILSNSPFRLSEGAFLNDTSEGRELFNYLSFETTKRTADETIAELFVEKPFIGSFVAENKHNDLILWRMYGKEAQAEAKGCALTINRTNFIDNLKKKVSPSDNKAGIHLQSEEQFTFYNVAYLLKDTFIIPGKSGSSGPQLNELMNNLKYKVKKLSKKQKISVTKSLNGIAYLFKSSEYQYENEVRLVVRGVGFYKNIEEESTPPKVYIELVDIVPALTKITLGPKVERADEWAAAFNYHIKEQLKDREEKVEIIISHLPFK